MTPTTSKLVMSAVAALCVIAAVLSVKLDPSISHSLVGAAGILLGWAWLAQPGQNGPPSNGGTIRPPPMPLLCLGMVLFLALGCKGALGPFTWPKVAHCAGNVPDLVAQVTQILLSDTGDANVTPTAEQQLEQLAEKYGADAVLCLVETLVADWTAPGAAREAHRTAAARRGKGFLLAVGTVFQ